MPSDEQTRWAYLEAMGLTPLWRLRARWPAAASGSELERLPAVAADESRNVAAEKPSDQASSSVPRTPISDLSPARMTTLPTPPQQDRPRALPGLPAPSAASNLPSPAPGLPTAGSSRGVDATRVARIMTLDWDVLEAEIRACQACALAQARTQAVPGVGDRRARWLFVGEGPGKEEDRLGEPFVGPAGKLLDEMLFALGLRRGQDVYIANAVKCRPPMNRTPHAEEIAACFPFLARQIALIQPRLIVALGKPAAFALLGEDLKIAAARGKVFRYRVPMPDAVDDREIPVIVTYHPAYLLRNPADKRKAWQDLCFARRVLMQRAG